MIDDPNPIETWLVELEGHPTVLANWQQLFRDRKVASVEPSPGRDAEHAYFVHSQRLDDLPDTAAHATAKRLVAQMNGAAKLCGGQPLQMARLWFVRAGGKPQPVKDVSASMASPIAIMTAIGAPTTAAPASPDRRALTAMTAARDCDQVASALQHFSQPTNWYDLWTAYEIIEEELWRNTPKIQRPKGKEKLKPRRVLLISRKWVSTDDLQKFAASCNYHRHGAKKPPTPEQNANTYEARQILARILQNWIDEKVL